MAPSDVADSFNSEASIQGGGPGEGHMDLQPDVIGNDLANAPFGAPRTGEGLWSQDTEQPRRAVHGAVVEKPDMDVAVTATASAGDQPRIFNEETVHITIDFLELASKSPKVAQTLYRADQAAYRAACGRPHVLRVKRRPLRAPMKPHFADIMQLGRAMKQQRRGILERLREEHARREYIKWELDVAVGKTRSRARRMEATSIAWNKWCTAKNSKLRQLDAVLGSPSGRRLWDEYLRNELVGAANLLTPSPGQHRGKSRNMTSLDEAKPRSAGPPGALSKDEEGAASEEIPTTATSDSHATERRLVEVVDSGSSILPETAVSGDIKESAIVTGGSGDIAIVVDSRVILAKLHLALENLSRQGGVGKTVDLDISACAQFCMEWPRDCMLPQSFDRALLQPAWSIVSQDLSDQCVGIEALHPAREAARLEAQHLFFAGFLGSSEGQAFVIHIIQDGTLEPTDVEGFMRDLTEGAHFDEDAQGFRRVVAHGDEWMHSRLVHDGVEQRVRVEVRGGFSETDLPTPSDEAAEPLLRAVQEENAQDISTHRGELAAIVQHVYSLAASRLQPFIRGSLARRRLPDTLWEMFSYAFLCAAVEIQRVVRGCIARRRCRQALVFSISNSLVRLQARIRGVLLRQRVAKKWATLLDRQASQIQRVFRGHLSRGVVKAVLKEKTWAHRADLQGWASLVLQRQARVWLARRIVHLKRVEVGLTSRVSEIADKLASSDDSRSVSAVLDQIDRDYRKYERVIGEMKAREEEMATTFVEKVLERRDADIIGAWTNFVGAVTGFSAGQKNRSEAHRANPHPVTRGKAAKACEIQDKKLLRLMERYGIPAHAKALPSAYLRAAVPMHLKLRGCELATGVDNHAPLPEAGAKGSNEKKKQRHVNNTNEFMGDRVSFRLKDGGTLVSQVQSSGRSRVAEGSFESSITSIGDGPSTTCPSGTTPVGGQESDGVELSSGRWQTKAHEDKDGDGDDYAGGDGGGKSCDSGLREDSAGKQTRTCGGGDAGGAEWCAANSRVENDGGTSSSGWESMWDAERMSRGITGDAGSRFPGSSVRQDMPSGVNEVVERLCAAAFLRGHVPDGLMQKGTTPDDAYQRYLNLPPSLAKIRHEQLCTEASRPVASALRSRGYTTLEQLLPLSKLEHLFRQAGAGVDESTAAMSLARDIKRRHDIGGSSDSNDRDMFSPLSPFSRRGLAGSRRTPDSTESTRLGGGCGSRGANTGTSSRGSRRPGTARVEGFSEPKKKKAPLRISLEGLGSVSKAAGADQDKWDPSRYTTRPEEWIRPPPSVIKRRWDEDAKAFVPINNYCFDALYRRHNRLAPQHDGDGDHFDDERNSCTRDDSVGMWRFEDDRPGDTEQEKSLSGADRSCPSGPVADSLPGPVNSGDSYAKRMAEIMQEEYGTFFDGMTQSARELYQYIVNDSASWGSVEDPIGTLLCRAAFHVVEHPSPVTKAELAVATEKDLASKVPMGPNAFRAFVGQLDATSASRPASSYAHTPNTTRTSRSYGAAPVDPCRTLLERRLEAAATLANPFKVCLEADGVSSVRELARVPARAWGLPPDLVEEIERMLSLLVARTCALEHYRAHRGHKRHRAPDGHMKPKKDNSSSESVLAGSVPKLRQKNPSGARKKRQQHFEFDPRFQKSPLDPAGRPPRLEKIHPCPCPRQQTSGDRHPHHGCRLSADDDDLPPGMWDTAAGFEDPSRHGVVETGRVETESGGAINASFPSVPVGSVGLETQIDPLAGDLPIDQRALVARRKSRSQVRLEQQPSHQIAKRKFVGDGSTTTNNSPTAEETRPSSTRFTCRARPHCRAVFARASALRTHERSHASAPEYHRLRRAPQLFRDKPPASSEGAGAAAAKFRLRTTLPPSIRRELQVLEGEMKDM